MAKAVRSKEGGGVLGLQRGPVPTCGRHLKRLANDTNELRELESRVRALVEPQLLHCSNTFISELNEIRSRRHSVPEWELQKNAIALAEAFVNRRVQLVVDGLKMVINIKKLRVTEKELSDLFFEIRPTIGDLKSIIYQNAGGSVIVVPDYFIDNAYDRISKVSIAELALLCVPTPKALRSSIITAQYVAPDTNVLIHFKHISQITPADISAPAPLRWLFLEQVIAELDNKAHHREGYYSKRARSLQKLISAAAEDPAALGRGSTSTIFLPNGLPDLGSLDLDLADHRILAQAVAFQQAQDGAAVTIATNDLILQLRARMVGLDVLAFPDELRRGRIDQSDGS
jgi:hypothetical protein